MPTEQEVKKGFQQHDAANLPSEIMVEELRNRGYTIISPVIEDEATGLLIQDGNYYDPETNEPVSKEVAYARASNGY
jgi:hypothetical protein